MTTYRNRLGQRDTTTPFLYAVGWPDEDAFYIGVRYATGCHPDDLWTIYFTSSKLVHAFARAFGPPPYMEILCTYETASDALVDETNVLSGHQIAEHFSFLNECNGFGAPKSADVCEAIRQGVLRRWSDEEYREQMTARLREVAESRMPTFPFQGRMINIKDAAQLAGTHSSTIKRRMQRGLTIEEAVAGPAPRKRFSEEVKRQISARNTGRTHSEASKQKMSESRRAVLARKS